MARGNASKELILRKMKQVFPEMFQSGKEYRIPVQEEGERVEIKVSLVCAKDNIGEDIPTLGGGLNFDNTPVSFSIVEKQEKEEDGAEAFNPNVTQEEKEEIQDLLTRLNL